MVYRKVSFKTINEAINVCTQLNKDCINNDFSYIMRQYCYKSQFMVDTLHKLLLAQRTKKKFNMYQLIYYNRPIKLYFILHTLDNFINICKKLNIEPLDVLILNTPEYYLIIHHYKYFNNKNELNKFLLNNNLEILDKRYIPFIFNSDITLICDYGTIIKKGNRIGLFELSIINPIVLNNLQSLSQSIAVQHNMFDIEEDELKIIIKCSTVDKKHKGTLSLKHSEEKEKKEKLLEISKNIQIDINNDNNNNNSDLSDNETNENELEQINIENNKKEEKLNKKELKKQKLEEEKRINEMKAIESIKSNIDTTIYKNLVDIITNKDVMNNVKNKIFKICKFENNRIISRNYICENLNTILELKKLIKEYHIYQYIDEDKPLKLYFYLNDIDLLEETCEILNINKKDLLILKLFNETQECKSDAKNFLIIHKSIYFNNKTELEMYFYKLKIRKFFINIECENYMPYIFNQGIEIISYYNISELDLLKWSILNIDITINHKYEEYNTKYVNNNDFDKTKELIFVESNMGSGKSTALVNYISNLDDIENKRILIISSRITLSNTIYQKFNDTDVKFDNYLLKPDIDTSMRLIISPDSLVKLAEPLDIYDLIWIDESTSLLTYIADYPYLGIRKIIDVLFRIIYQAKQVIMTDANIGDIIVEIYKKIKKTNNYQYLHYNNFECDNTFAYKNYTNILNDVKEDLENNKNIYICSDSIRETKKMYDYCSSFLNEEDILIYNGESGNKYDKCIMEGVNQFWSKYRVVIVSPKVIYGIDFTELHFDKVYGIYRSNVILSFREVLQQINRIRFIKEKSIILNIRQAREKYIYSLYTFTFFIENQFYRDLFPDKNFIDIDNILKLMTFNYTNDNYRIIDRDNPHNLIIILNQIEHNKGLNRFEIQNIN
jgi:hypothetical protein